MFGVDVVILNANAITFDSKTPTAEAVAVQNGLIVAVGSNETIRPYIGKNTKVINANGKTVIPGFVDCHVHMTSFGRFLQTLDLRAVTSIKELQEKLRAYSEKNPGKSWILGGRWDQEKFVEGRYPTRWDLDEAVADKPVFLTRVCGHVAVANSLALEKAGITGETVVRGGSVDLDDAGKPSGILRENAMELVWKAVPKSSFEELEEACLLASTRAVKAGITCVHWIVDSAEEIRVIQKLYRVGKLPLRVYLGVPAELLDRLVDLGLCSGFGDDMVKIGFVKIFADGSLGARTAALKEPYFDKPESCGMLVCRQRKLDNLILRAHVAGLQVAVHAIGDFAVECVLKAYSRAFKRFSRGDHRHRIEHCSVLNPKLIRQMKRLGLIASVQPHFVFSDFWITDRLGEARARWAYPFKTLLREGVTVVFGSDCPVEPIEPLRGIWAAVARKSFSEESLSLEEALRCYTLSGACASFDEDKRGSISVRKLADLVILSEDLTSVPPEKIKDVDVDFVLVNGKVVYEKGC